MYPLHLLNTLEVLLSHDGVVTPAREFELVYTEPIAREGGTVL